LIVSFSNYRFACFKYLLQDTSAACHLYVGVPVHEWEHTSILFSFCLSQKLTGLLVFQSQLGELHKILDGCVHCGKHCHSIDPETCWCHWMGSTHDGALIFCGLWRGNPVVPPDEQ
jgi:hypothetical protein